MNQQQQSRWWSTGRQRWALLIGFVVILICGLLIYATYAYEKTLWDLLKIVAVPLTIGGAVPLLNYLQKRRELDVEAQRTRNTTTQGYLDQLTQLLLDKKDGRLVRMDTTNEYTREVVSARTDAILRHLDKENQQSIVEFLHGLGLLNRKEKPVVSLAGLNFTGINWDRADLERADLREVDCSFASLVEANLQEADLEGADLEGADLTGATLTEAHLMDADLSGADLSGANLGGADLSNATVTQEQLDQIKYLQGATMPNGQKYEDWLKSKARGEEGENSDPSHNRF